MIFGLFAFIWLPALEVDAALQLKSPPDCETTDSLPCGRTDEVTIFRWTRSENPLVQSYHVFFSEDPDFIGKNFLELPGGGQKIIAPQVAVNLLGNGFDLFTTYFWRVDALDGSGEVVELGQEIFAFFYDIPDARRFTVISGLVKSDFNQLGLAGTRVAVSSARHTDTKNVTNRIAETEFNGEYIVIAISNDEGQDPAPIEITFTKEGFEPTNIFLPVFKSPPSTFTPEDLVMIADFDGDGISNVVENASTCLDADDADTDDDGIVDGDEDTNKNGVINSGETDPCRLDTDNDGIQDGTELGLTLDDIGPDTDMAIFKQDLDPSTTSNPLDDDSDGDGQLDGEEDQNRNGRVDAHETEPGFLNARALPAILPLLIGD